jgi:hypothetical protein
MKSRFFGSLVLVMALCSCSRENELRGEGTRFVLPPRLAPPDSGIPTVHADQDLLGPTFPACRTRSFGDCYGGNDFPCAFDQWARGLANKCQRATGCRANGWVAFETNGEGCTSRIGMTTPQPEFAACLREAMGNLQCPCGAVSLEHFLGIGHDGCDGVQECGGAEFPCPSGLTCVAGACVAGEGGAASSIP